LQAATVVIAAASKTLCGCSLTGCSVHLGWVNRQRSL
jgi:hypothetical protein